MSIGADSSSLMRKRCGSDRAPLVQDRGDVGHQAAAEIAGVEPIGDGGVEADTGEVQEGRPLTRPVSMSRGRPSMATCTAACRRSGRPSPAQSHCPTHRGSRQGASPCRADAGDLVEGAVAAPHDHAIGTRIEGLGTASVRRLVRSSPWPGWSWLQACVTGDSPRARARVAARDRSRDPTRGSLSDLRSFRFPEVPSARVSHGGGGCYSTDRMHPTARYGRTCRES